MSFTFNGVQQSIPITNGNLFVSTTGLVPIDLLPITRLIVALSDGIDEGIVNTILIIDSQGEQVFCCRDLTIQNGTNLIEECGFDSITLRPGLTNYTVQGSSFGPDMEGMLTIYFE